MVDPSPTIEVVIPIRNMGEHIGPCIDSLARQLGPRDRITVVDDASEDDTVSIVTAREVKLIRRFAAGGPYASRHLAAQESEADVLLFLDGRCRARDGLIEAHRTQFQDPLIALSCTRLNVVAGPSLASRVAAASGVFNVDTAIGVPGRLDFFPTANLGVRRSAYNSVGGFRRMQSGGDADLCWRVQLGGLGSFGVDQRVLVDWIPRGSLRDLFSQWRRYGESAAYLDLLYPKTPIRLAAPADRLNAIGRGLQKAAHHPRQLPIQAIVKLLTLTNSRAYAREVQRLGPSVAPPESY